MQGLGVFIHIDAGSIILVKIGGCGFDQLPRGAVDRPPFLPLAADQHQHHLEQPGRIIPIGVLAELQFLDHTAESIFVLRHNAAVKHMAIQRNLMRLQHCSGLAAGKIDPEHLRVVLKIVDIAALFLRAVQHHMTRCYHMLGIIKPEVRLARSDIKQLIRIFIIPRNSWQAGVLFQSACSAGIHCKRCSTAAVRSLAAVDGTKIDIHLCCPLVLAG